MSETAKHEAVRQETSQAVLSTTAPIPFKVENQAAGDGFAAWGALILLVIGAWLVVRRLGRRGTVQPARARVLESHRLGQRGTVAVVEFAGQCYLIAQTEHSCSCIAQAPADPR